MIKNVKVQKNNASFSFNVSDEPHAALGFDWHCKMTINHHFIDLNIAIHYYDQCKGIHCLEEVRNWLRKVRALNIECWLQGRDGQGWTPVNLILRINRRLLFSDFVTVGEILIVEGEKYPDL